MGPRTYLFAFRLNPWPPKGRISLLFQNFTREGVGLQLQVNLDLFWIKLQQGPLKNSFTFSCIFSADYSGKFPNKTKWLIFMCGALPRSSVFCLITCDSFLFIPKNPLSLWQTWLRSYIKTRFLLQVWKPPLLSAQLQKGSFLSRIQSSKASLHLPLFDSFIVYFLFVLLSFLLLCKL